MVGRPVPHGAPDPGRPSSLPTWSPLLPASAAATEDQQSRPGLGAGRGNAGMTLRHGGGKAGPGGRKGGAPRAHPTGLSRIKGGAAVNHGMSCVRPSHQPCEAGGARYHYPHFTDERLRLTKASGDLSRLAEMDSNPRIFQLGLRDIFCYPPSCSPCLWRMKITRGPDLHQERGHRQCLHP